MFDSIDEEMIKAFHKRREEVRQQCDNTYSVGRVGELLVLLKCLKHGFGIEDDPTAVCDFIVNEYIVEVKSTLSKKTGRTRFAVRQEQLRRCKFVVCVIIADNAFYIVPSDKVLNRSVIVGKGCPHEKYKGRWSLLK